MLGIGNFWLVSMDHVYVKDISRMIKALHILFFGVKLSIAKPLITSSFWLIFCYLCHYQMWWFSSLGWILKGVTDWQAGAAWHDGTLGLHYNCWFNLEAEEKELVPCDVRAWPTSYLAYTWHSSVHNHNSRHYHYSCHAWRLSQLSLLTGNRLHTQIFHEECCRFQWAHETLPVHVQKN